jgi:2-polyprenyl-3-methyl-5-hydroxy-6-metoxy-1,4-benzoquinol methylase
MAGCTHPESRAEPLFPSADYVTGETFEVRRCGACGLALTWPPPPPDALGRYYPPAYYGAPGRRRFLGPIEVAQNLLYGWRARQVERLAGGRPGRVLDVGCGRGHLLEAFRRRGWSVEGTELSESSARQPREAFGLQVHVGPLESIALPRGAFDAVTMWHVLEHVPDPVPLLAEIGRLLRPGGVFMVGVPNFGSPEAKATRGGWFHLDVPRHLVHFTPETLRALLAQAGLSEVAASWFAPEFDAFSFVQSAENRLGLRMNLLYDLLRQRAARLGGAGAGVLPFAAALLLAVPLGLAALLVPTVASLAGSGSSLTIYARKP